MTVKIRDRERTKGTILKAVGEVIQQHGIQKVGVNLVARTAGVNKVLIYRYFESVDGLLKQYARSRAYTATANTDCLQNEAIAPEVRCKALAIMMQTLIHDLRESKQTRDLLRWEIGAGKSLHQDEPNLMAMRIWNTIGDLPNYTDTSALISFLTAGVYYMTLSTESREKIIDVNIHSNEGWQRIEKVIDMIIANIHD